MENTSLGFKKPTENEYYDIGTVNHNTQLANDLIEGNTSAIGQMAYNLISNEEIDSMEPITGLPVGGGGDLGDATPIQPNEIDNILN